MGNNMVVVIVYYVVVRHLYEVMEINVRDCWDFSFTRSGVAGHDENQEGIKLIACFIEKRYLCARCSTVVY